MNCDGPIRAFVAIEITPEIRERIEALQKRLGVRRARIRWVKPENIHLTLEFLGDITLETSKIVCLSLDSIAGLHMPLACEVRGLGYFGRRHAPKVIWAGISGDVEKLVQIQSALHLKLKADGIQTDEKPFVPHLTIARFRTHQYAEEIVESIESHNNDSLGSFDVKELVLFKSDLSSSGPTYTALHRSILR